ncbi:hypothetical protein PMIN03_007382 [Paraphaeosphaeria minitans]|uniref:Tol-like protein n=1 Tax=Paraphaeosphaeria minitans TaxID=565426 RepID=A0A9P6KQT1_9PLEO|nr:tol-like protein [Paraphaeosphaeria minitans]
MDDLDLDLDDLGSALPEQPDTLSTRILNSLREGTSSLEFPSGSVLFLPEGKINSIITRNDIFQELQRSDRCRVSVNRHRHREPADKCKPCTEDQLEKLSDWIYHNARKIFALTLYCTLEEADTIYAMNRFRQHQFGDDRLPVEESVKSVNASDDTVKIFPRKIWTPVQRRRFYDDQWKFRVIVFTRGRYDYDLDSNDIFPFTVGSSTMPKVGGFGAVYKIRFREEHQENPRMLTVALKEIKLSVGKDKTEVDDAWEREAVSLKEINRLQHPNITPCIAAIRRGDGRYFMFPWADGDNLREFWDRTPSKPLTPELVQHAIGQLHGIADALQKLHNIETNPPINIKPIFEEPELEKSRSDVPFIDVQGADGTMNNSLVDSHKISMRHGDLKPENILVFSDPEQGHSVFRIADMGLAKKHLVETNLRGKITSTMFGTRRYEPPEAGGVQSRLFDIWSMGCIVFEYIIWLLYGNAVLKDFIREIDTDQGQYFETRVGGPQTEHAVRSVVRRWIDHIQTNEPECSQQCAIRDLLEIIKNKLLVVNLPPDSASSLSTGTGRLFKQPLDAYSITKYRAKAVDFRNALAEVLEKIETGGPRYLLTGKSRASVGPPGSNLLSEKATSQRIGTLKSDKNSIQKTPLTGIHGRNYKADYSLPPLKGWEFPIDNKFSEMVAARVKNVELWPMEPSKICTQCRELNFLSGGFAFEEEIATLQERSETCVLCRLIHNAFHLVSTAQSQRVRIERQNSKLVIASNPMPILSIFRGPNLKPPPPLQLGFPKLPEPGSSAFFDILKLWLSDCDLNHQDCHVGTKRAFPTRLVDVGTSADPELRLMDTREEKPTDHRYIALSHPWGDTKRYPPFNTVRKDVTGEKRDVESFKERIPYEELPATFRDTVDSTRALGIRYLWIDSICIVQGPDGDFSEEAKKMEDVYSGAFCVLAASRAQHQHDGFLQARPRPDYATLIGPGGHPYYVCHATDNFTEDVLQGSLNQRGWVLQERALARRTIYFTEAQTYFECGNGIRCETMTKMHNTMADFLGDPNFPTKAMRTESRALKISYFQDLYKTYSRLSFTRDDDRPFALAGIEKRLQVAYSTRGGYGIFDDGPDGGLFHRSLLWKRSDEEKDSSEEPTEHKRGAMRLINFPFERNILVPSWSWMAYTGGIEYTDPPWRSADWEKDEISPPWTRKDDGTQGAQSAPHHLDMALKAVVRDFNLAGRSKEEVFLTYDVERTASDGQRTQCVIVARSRMETSVRDKTHYVLLVAAERMALKRGEKVYKRVGAGFMPGKYIAQDVPGTPARIY